MKEMVAAIVLYLAIKMTGTGSPVLIAIGMLLSLAAVLYIGMALLERRLIGGRWFRATPGKPQVPPFSDDDDDLDDGDQDSK